MKAFAVLSLAALVRALSVSTPNNITVWTAGEMATVAWDAVDTDPSEFNVVLVKQNSSPTLSKTLGEKVPSRGVRTYVVDKSATSGLAAGEGYQVNLVSVTNGGILAQSGMFTIKAGGAAPPSPSHVPSPGPAPPGPAPAPPGYGPAPGPSPSTTPTPTGTPTVTPTGVPTSTPTSNSTKPPVTPSAASSNVGAHFGALATALALAGLTALLI